MHCNVKQEGEITAPCGVPLFPSANGSDLVCPTLTTAVLLLRKDSTNAKNLPPKFNAEISFKMNSCDTVSKAFDKSSARMPLTSLVLLSITCLLRSSITSCVESDGLNPTILYGNNPSRSMCFEILLCITCSATLPKHDVSEMGRRLFRLGAFQA